MSGLASCCLPIQGYKTMSLDLPSLILASAMLLIPAAVVIRDIIGARRRFRASPFGRADL